MAATLSMTAVITVAGPTPAAHAAIGGDASAEAVALAEAARTGHRVEVKEEDTETETVYANPDGTVTSEISSVPIRVRDADGKLVPIDTSLASDSGRLAPANSPADVSFSATGTGVLAQLDTVGATSFGLGAPRALDAPAVADDTATYPVSGADPASVQVATTTDGFSAHVVLPSAPTAAPTYTFPLDLQGLTPSLHDNQLYLSDRDGKVVALSAPLSMWDAHTDAAGDADHQAPVDAELVTTNGQTALQLKPSMAFLTDPGTVYPVVVDPDVSPMNATVNSDTEVFANDGDGNYSTNYASRAGISTTAAWRSYEKFYVDKFLGKTVTSATLKMFQYYGSSCAARTTDVLPVEFKDLPSAPLTWNNKPASNNSLRWSTTFTGNSGGPNSGCGTGAMQSMDVTKMVNGFVTGALDSDIDNDGDDKGGHVATIELRGHDESSTADNDKRFCSMNTGQAPTTPTRHECAHVDADTGLLDRGPTLSVSWLPDLGEKPYYSTTDHELNDRTTLQINNQDGNAVIKAQDVQIAGRSGMGAKVTRYYNSRDDDTTAPTNDLSMGPKWSLSVGSDVRLWKRSTYQYDYVAPGGAIYPGFFRKADSSSNPDFFNFKTPRGSVGADLDTCRDATTQAGCTQDDVAAGVFRLVFHQSQKKYFFASQAGSTTLYLSKETDRSGNTITYTYTPGGHQLASMQDASGHTLNFTWTGGVITQITDSNGPTTRTWQYGYTNGRLTSYTDPKTYTTEYAYTSGTNPMVNTINDPSNDTGDRPKTSIRYSSDQATTVMYSKDTDSTSTSNSDSTMGTNGYTAQYYSDTADRCDSDVNYASVWTSSGGTSVGKTTYCFKDRGTAAGPTQAKTDQVIDGNGNSRKKTYTADNQASVGTGAGASAGSTVATYGDASDQLTKTTDSADDGASSGSATTMTYNKNSGKNGATWLPTSKTDGNGQCIAYGYDNKETDPAGDPTPVTAKGRLTDARISADTGACEGQSTGGAHYHQQLNTDGTIRWSYDPNGSNAVAQRTNYSYGGQGMVTEITKPGGSCGASARKLCTSYTYDGLARISTMTDGRGKVTTYSYDEIDRVTQVLLDGATTCSTSAGTCVKYVYDKEGNLTSRVDAQGTTAYDYNRLNRQTKIDTPDNSTVGYAYNDDGKMTQLSVSALGAATQTWAYGYDKGLLPETVTIGALGKTINLAHDENSRLKSTTFPTAPNTVNISRGYTKSGRPKTITVTRSGTDTSQLPDWTYSYQTTSGTNTIDTNQVQQIKVDGSTTAINRTLNYDYGKYDRLTKARTPDGDDFTYDYDDAFNLKSEKIGTGTGSTTYYGFDMAGELCWQGAAAGTATQTLQEHCAGTTQTPSTDSVVTQDAAGNSQGTAANPLAYNAYNQVNSLNGVTQTYNDLGNDLRVQTAPNTYLVNSNPGIIARKTSAGVTYYTRSPDGKLLGEYGASGTYYFVTNAQDSVTTLVDTTGARAGYYRYSPYGNPNIIEDNTSNAAAGNPFRYISGYYDIEGDGYTKLGARYYDNSGHFTQPDPQPGSINDPMTMLAYGYATSDPMNNSDQTGQLSFDDVMKFGDRVVSPLVAFGQVANDIRTGQNGDAIADTGAGVLGITLDAGCGAATALIAETGPIAVSAGIGCAAGVGTITSKYQTYERARWSSWNQ